MTNKTIYTANHVGNPFLQEMRDRLERGVTVRISFGGGSMMPLIRGAKDKVELQPLSKEECLRVGEVYLFQYEDRYVIHRLLGKKGGLCVFRGDACYRKERVDRSVVLARLVTVEHADGHRIRTDGAMWRMGSVAVVTARSVRNLIARGFSSKQRRWESPLYFFLLAFLMWAPLNGMGIPLDNYVFGLRMDHLVHASVYLFCAFFLTDWMKGRKWAIWPVAVLVGIATESVQYVLPYRGFDINDMAANFIGATAGWLVLIPYWRKRFSAK